MSEYQFHARLRRDIVDTESVWPSEVNSGDSK